MGGIVKMTINDASRRSKARVKVAVTGRDGSYPVQLGDEPLRATIVFGGPVASEAGLCGEALFGPEDCAFNRSMTSLSCRR